MDHKVILQSINEQRELALPYQQSINEQRELALLSQSTSEQSELAPPSFKASRNNASWRYPSHEPFEQIIDPFNQRFQAVLEDLRVNENLNAMSNSVSKTKKPGVLRFIFILNIVLVLASFSFYGWFASLEMNQAATPGNIPSYMILFNSIAYVLTFVLMLISILKKKIWITRASFLIDLIVSITIVFAPIGLMVGSLSIGFSFHKKVKEYFKS